MKSSWLACLGLVVVTGVALADHSTPRRFTHTDPAAPSYSWPATDLDRDGVFDRLDRFPGTPRGVEVDQWGCRMGASSARSVQRPAAYPPGVESAYRGELLRSGRIRLDMAFFNTGRAELRPGAKRALLEVSAIVRAYPTLKFEVGGHADSRGSEAYNRDLSQRRALAVRQFLMERGRVRRIQLAARGYGESRPATTERNRREYQANRRVELRVLNPEAMPRGSKVDSRDAMEALAAQSARGARGTMLAAGQ